MEQQALFGSKIRSIREAANLSRETVAERADTGANYLGEVERGEKFPTLEMIERIAAALDVSPSMFFEYEAEDTDNQVLMSKIRHLLSQLSTDQLQQALRVLKALFKT
jgi:transcriptional regulator with XRE-family HTH domain